MDRKLSLCVAAAISAAICHSASAVIIKGGDPGYWGDGSGNTTGAGTVAGWSNVGYINSLGSGSGVYLDNGWVLTAAHVGAGTFVIPGTGSFSYDSNTVHRLHEPGNSNGVDLYMFRLKTIPSLPSLTIASTTPSVNTGITMIGCGYDRASSITYYDSAWQELPTGTAATYAGFKYGASYNKRWGTNTVLALGTGSTTETISIGWGNTIVFGANFDANGGASECMVANGDSGGATFNTSTDELIGIIDAKGPYANQPGFTAMFGNTSYMVNLADYRSQIVAIVPEPTSATLILGAMAGFSLKRSRREDQPSRG